MHFIKDDVGLYTCFNPNAKAVDTWYSVKGPCIDNTHLDMHYIQDGFLFKIKLLKFHAFHTHVLTIILIADSTKILQILILFTYGLTLMQRQLILGILHFI